MTEPDDRIGTFSKVWDGLATKQRLILLIALGAALFGAFLLGSTVRSYLIEGQLTAQDARHQQELLALKKPPEYELRLMAGDSVSGIEPPSTEPIPDLDSIPTEATTLQEWLAAK